MTNEELWMLLPIYLIEHQQHWKEDFREEAKLLMESIGAEYIKGISHIGKSPG